MVIDVRANISRLFESDFAPFLPRGANRVAAYILFSCAFHGFNDNDTKPWTKDSRELRMEFRGVGKIYCDLSPGDAFAHDDTAGFVLGNIAARL